jgi:hypothetical protein
MRSGLLFIIAKTIGETYCDLWLPSFSSSKKIPQSPKFYAIKSYQPICRDRRLEIYGTKRRNTTRR